MRFPLAYYINFLLNFSPRKRRNFKECRGRKFPTRLVTTCVLSVTAFLNSLIIENMKLKLQFNEGSTARPDEHGFDKEKKSWPLCKKGAFRVCMKVKGDILNELMLNQLQFSSTEPIQRRERKISSIHLFTSFYPLAFLYPLK